jgi:hypothetical protein
MKEDLQAALAGFERGDSAGLDAFLMTQAHVLDIVFNRTMQVAFQYGLDEDRLNLALRTHRECRSTAEAVRKIAARREERAKRQKSSNELLSGGKNEALDRGR